MGQSYINIIVIFICVRSKVFINSALHEDVDVLKYLPTYIILKRRDGFDPCVSFVGVDSFQKASCAKLPKVPVSEMLFRSGRAYKRIHE